MEQKRKEEIRKSIIACDNDIVKLRLNCPLCQGHFELV